MADAQHSRKKRDDEYRRTRDTFNEMTLEDQATFLVEATTSMLARGIEEAGRVMAEGLDDLFRHKTAHKRHSEDAKGPGPAEPETAQQRRPRGGAHDESSD